MTTTLSQCVCFHVSVPSSIASMAEYQRRKREEEEEGKANKEDDSQKFFAGGSEHRCVYFTPTVYNICTLQPSKHSVCL